VSVLEQLVFDLDPEQFPPKGEHTQVRPLLSRYCPPGAARLLKRLVAGGLDLDALEVAAALVAELDAEPACLTHASAVAA
jgi:hypothetical protein